MPWVRIDDHFDEHPKFLKAGPLAMALWVAGLAYCNRNLTDGFIPLGKVAGLCSWTFLDEPDAQGRSRVVKAGITSGMSGDDVDPEYLAQRLVNAGLWEYLGPEGYRVHDYLDYQTSRKEVLRERDRKALNQKAFRERNRDRNRESYRPVTAPPTPTPSLTPSLKNGSTEESFVSEVPALSVVVATSARPKPRAKSVPKHDPESFELFWAKYPRREARIAACKAWDALKPGAITLIEMSAGLQRYIRLVQGRPPDKIAHPATWLNGERWNDEQTIRVGRAAQLRELGDRMAEEEVARGAS